MVGVAASKNSQVISTMGGVHRSGTSIYRKKIDTQKVYPMNRYAPGVARVGGDGRAAGAGRDPRGDEISGGQPRSWAALSTQGPCTGSGLPAPPTWKQQIEEGKIAPFNRAIGGPAMSLFFPPNPWRGGQKAYSTQCSQVVAHLSTNWA